MDITLLTNTIAAGATEAIKDTAAQLLKDAYATLKQVLGQKLDGATNADDVAAAMRSVERKPDAPARQNVLCEAFSEAYLVIDDEIQQAAQSLINILLRFAPQTAAQYNVIAHSSTPIVEGNAVAGKGGIVIKSDRNGKVVTSVGAQISNDYGRSDHALGDKIRRQVNTGGGAYIGGGVPSTNSYIGRETPIGALGGDSAAMVVADAVPGQSVAGRTLLPLLNTYFAPDELDALCVDMGIDDNLYGQNKDSKARLLVSICERRGQLDELKKRMRLARPNLGGLVDSR